MDTGGTRALSTSDDGTIKIWDLTTGKHLKSLSAKAFDHIAMTPDGKGALSGSGNGPLIYWDLTSGTCHTLRNLGESFFFKITADGTRALLAANYQDNYTIELWDLTEKKCLQNLTGHSCKVFDLKMSADETRVFSTSCATFKLWDLTTGKCLKTMFEYE